MVNHRYISNVMQIEIFQQVFEIKSRSKNNKGGGDRDYLWRMFHRYIPFHLQAYTTVAETELTDIKKGGCFKLQSPCSGRGLGMN